MIQTDFPIKVTDGELPVTHFAQTEGDAAKSVVLMVPAVFGVDEVTIKHAQMMVEKGSEVYAVDSFWRTHPGPLGQSDTERDLALKRMADVKDHDCDGDIAALVRFIREQRPQSKLVILGICFGGRPAVRAAADGLVDACAAWHGIRIGELGEALSEVRCPASLHFGAVDPWVPMEEVQAIAQGLEHCPVLDLQIHSHCDHGFTHFGRAAFNQDAYQDAWNGLRKLL